PARVGIGVAGMTFFGVLWLAGGNDIIAHAFHIPLFATTWFFRFAVIVGPIVGFEIARRMALGLQHREREVLEHGVETGIIMRLPNGAYIEKARPLDEEEKAMLCSRRLIRALPPPRPDEQGVEPKEARRPTTKLRIALNRIYVADVVPLPDGEREEHPPIESEAPKS
ncbi:MAG: Cytochrome b/b6 domain protein, partial [Actinoallomurus sp.]|nr:Cytochrome b/b6 domain protein [Actinoallomurus sp.]